jgi:hypothetical protein
MVLAARTVHEGGRVRSPAEAKHHQIMKAPHTPPRFATIVALLAVVSFSSAEQLLLAVQSSASVEDRVAALKQSLAESHKRIQQYEWVETTAISLKGEEKARKQQRLYYGADGKLVKIPIGEASQKEAQQGGGRRGGRLKQRIVENKKDEMQEYMERASNLVHQYVPPNPVQIQGAQDKGKMAIRPGVQGRVTLEFSDYLLAGDRLGIAIDAAANRLLGLSVATYLEKAEEAVTLNVRMGSLADGTGYTAQTTLEAAAKNIRVVIENGGHRPLVR